MRAVLLSMLALALAADRAYPCAEPMLTDEAITPDGAVIPNGGGVVITTVDGGNPNDAEGARLMAGTTNVELRRDTIAPALTVIVAKPQANRAIELVGRRGTPIVKLAQGDVVPKHAAPKLARFHSTLAPRKTTRDAQQMWEASSQYTVELAEVPPSDVLALVVFVKDIGVAWARPQKGQLVYSFWAGASAARPGRRRSRRASRSRSRGSTPAGGSR